MAGVMQKFLVASMFMWMLPIAILYAFNHDLLPGILTLEPSYNYLLREFLCVSFRALLKAWSLEVFELRKSILELGALDLNPKGLPLRSSTTLSPHSLTLLSGFLAVVSVNVVIVFYICLALKEPTDKHKPDASFVAEAKDSVKKLTSGVPSTDPALKKQE
ncbi:hypothetical protein YC2023_028017 [Brassica napus]